MGAKFNRESPRAGPAEPGALRRAGALAAGAASALLAMPGAVTAEPATVVKSPTDPAEYRLLRLENGLTALLVSDPDADLAAAALDVHIGSGSDPDGWNGLAHFLEHMLFLGTEKYPRAGAYQRFIADHGGSTNAYTSLTHTNYHFSVAAAHLQPALDRFAQFFIAPTFDAAFVERERQVVESEYRLRLKDERVRMYSARRQALNPAHPGARFTTGTAETLRDRDRDGDGESGGQARAQLIDFYRRHYSANLMTLAVIGREPLVQLAHWVQRMFADVPNRGAALPRFDAPYIAPRSLPARLDARPQKDAPRLNFTFPIASVEAHYRSKPLRFIAGIIGHEGKGSLLARLKSLGWAHNLSAGAGYMDAVQGTFEVSVELTADGLQRIDAIGELLFRHIAQLAADGVERWRFDEARRLAEVDFRFAEIPPPPVRARLLAARLHDYPAEDALQGPYRLDEFRPDLIRALIADLRPDNVLVQVASKDAAAADAKFSTTPFYDVEYAHAPLSTATVERWTRALDGDGGDGGVDDGDGDSDGDGGDGGGVDGDADSALALPPPNPFIPARLTPHKFSTAPHAIVVPRRLQLPKNAAHIDAWHLGDPDFNAPRAAFFANFDTRLANDSARNSALTALFIRMVRRRLNAVGYPARLAGLSYHIHRPHRGFSLRVSGYADKQPVLLEAVLAALFGPDFDAGEFAQVAAALKRDWQNAAHDPPANQAARAAFRLLADPAWGEAERLAVLDALTVADLESHAAALLATAAIVTLSHGDVTAAEAAAMNAQVAAAFAGAGAGAAPAPSTARLRKLAAGRAYLRSIDVEHNDSALVAYFQGADKSDAERARMRLLAQLLEAPFFFDLRTTHRVGYAVYAAPWGIMEVPGMAFSVQSPSHGPADIERLTHAFLDSFDAQLARMPADEFAQTKRGLIDSIEARDTRLTQRSERFWRDIAIGRFDFDSRRRLVQELEALDRAAMRAYFGRVVGDHPRLLVQSPGRRPGAQGIDGGEFIRTGAAAEFRQVAREFFPQ